MNLTGDKISTIQVDCGELRSKKFATWCNSHGITLRFTSAHTSIQNGKLKRLHRTYVAMARAMRRAARCPLFLWNYFFQTAIYLRGFTPTKATASRTPYELFWAPSRTSFTSVRLAACATRLSSTSTTLRSSTALSSAY